MAAVIGAVLTIGLSAGCGQSTPSLSSIEQETRTEQESTRQTEAAEKQVQDEQAAEHAKEAKAARETAHQEHEILRLLTHKAAVGMTTSQVRHILGPPNHDQEVAGQVFWYYTEEGSTTEYQLVISGGRVSSINKY